jgi:transposase
MLLEPPKCEKEEGESLLKLPIYMILHALVLLKKVCCDRCSQKNIFIQHTFSSSIYESYTKSISISTAVNPIVAGTTARCTAELVGVNFKTAAYYFCRLRERISQEMARESQEAFSGEIEVDESYFGGTRKGKRGRGAAGKVPVFGLLKRGGKVYTQIIPDAKATTLVPIIEEKVIPDSIVYSDCWRGYNTLDITDFKHYRINHSKLFADKKNHINGIENFWNQAKRHMRKFNGIPKHHFGLFLKACEWRFNNPNPKQQLIQLHKWIKGYLI